MFEELGPREWVMPTEWVQADGAGVRVAVYTTGTVIRRTITYGVLHDLLAVREGLDVWAWGWIGCLLTWLVGRLVARSLGWLIGW